MKNLVSRVAFVLLLLILGACATTRMKGAWVNPDYQGKGFQKVLVLGVADNQTYLRMFEDAMTSELKQTGVKAEPGYSLFPDETRPDKKEIARQIADKGFDAMIISRVTGKSTERVIYPGDTYYVRHPYFTPPLYHRYWYDYYNRSYAIVREPDYVSSYRIVTVESNVYDAGTGELIWSAVTDTVVDGRTRRVIDSLAGTLVDKLDGTGLLQP